MEPRGRVCIRVFEEGVGHHKVVIDARAEEDLIINRFNGIREFPMNSTLL